MENKKIFIFMLSVNGMGYLLMVAFFFYACAPKAQSSFYEDIELGKFNVGYFDTLTYDMEQSYNQYAYNGPAPIFLQIWHPVKESKQKQYLAYKNFRKRNLPGDLNEVYAKLCEQMDESFITYNIAENFDTFEPIDYGQYSYKDLLEEISGHTTRSIYYKINANNNFPIIIYHHGSQGLSDENYIMAEYFASRGYIFVSASYHLPYESLDYGFTEAFSDRATEWPKIVSDFSKNLTTSKICFYIGHSWGAQIGFRYLHEDDWADAFVSMETTIEPKTNSLEIKEKWAEVYDVIKTQDKKYSLPILMFGGNGSQKPFPFFENISNSGQIIYASTKKEFGHESYTSAYLLRYFYRKKYKQPDSTSMKSQVQLYHRHLELIHSFFESVKKNRSLKFEPFKKDFYFH